MAKLRTAAEVSIQISLDITETEARALDALAGYSTDEFLKVFYEEMGQHYLAPHEEGIRSLFSVIRGTIPGYLAKLDAARRGFHGV